jgi:hypothetical protein
MEHNGDPLGQVDRILTHIKETLGENPMEPRAWQFFLRPTDIDMAEELGQQLEEEGYDVSGAEHVETTTIGPPVVFAFWRGVLTPDEIRGHVRKFIALAEREGIVYEGMDAMSLEEFDQIFGEPKLLGLEDAIWRLRHLTDMGVEENAPVTFMFGYQAEDPDAAVEALEAAGHEASLCEYDDLSWNVEVRVAGANDEKTVRAAFAAAQAAADEADAAFVGMQFEPEGEEE